MEQRNGGAADEAFKPVEAGIPLAELEEINRFRILKQPGMRAFQRLMLWGIPLFSLVFNFEVPSRFGAPMLQEQYLGLILILVLGSVFLSVPANSSAPKDSAPWYDLLLLLLSFVAGGDPPIFFPPLPNEIGGVKPAKIAPRALGGPPVLWG